MPTESSSIQLVVGLNAFVFVSIGWAIALALTGGGRLGGRPGMFGWGIVATGLITLATPVSFALYVAFRDGVFAAGPLDLILIVAFAGLGGVIMAVGSTYVRLRSPRARPAVHV